MNDRLKATEFRVIFLRELSIQEQDNYLLWQNLVWGNHPHLEANKERMIPYDVYLSWKQSAADFEALRLWRKGGLNDQDLICELQRNSIE